MSVEACAKLVQRADPDRFRAAMTAAPQFRPALLTLYAFNVEIFHAAWAAASPLAGEIRLQYWHDQISAVFQGRDAGPHPVMTPLARLIEANALSESDFLGLINARRWDVDSLAFAGEAAFKAYLAATGGNLMALAARLLMAGENHHDALRHYGYAAGLAAFMQAVPRLKARGRQPLVDESDSALRSLAADALARLEPPRRYRQQMRPALPALMSASEARPVLRNIVRNPSLVLKGGLERPEFRRRWRRLSCAMLGRW